MARKRMLHPDFFTSHTMNALPIPTMMTFAGIWCWADDYGRGEWAPELVKAAVWPRRKQMTEARVEAAMVALVEAGSLCRYEVAGNDLLHCITWADRQQVSHPAKPKLPPCPIHDADDYESFLADTDSARERFRRISGGTPEDSLTWGNGTRKAKSSGGAPEGLLRSVVEVSSDQISRGPRAIPNRHLSDATRRASLGIAGDD